MWGEGAFVKEKASTRYPATKAWAKAPSRSLRVSVRVRVTVIRVWANVLSLGMGLGIWT